MSEITTWRYYRFAMLPICAPHEEADTSKVFDGSIWKDSRKPFLARWTSGFDCRYETEWWYCIKDTVFDISAINAKKRYEINKGIKNFEVKKINPVEKAEEIFEVLKKAYSAYPEKYRPTADFEELKTEAVKWAKDYVFGAYDRETGVLCGYAVLIKNGKHIMFSIQKTDPEKEKSGINAALVFGILEAFKDDINNGCYIVDGERNLVHETNFQNYLEKYFQFRKAYCNLNMAYKPVFGLIVKTIYPFRKILTKLDGINIFHQINGILKMEEIARNCKNNNLKEGN